MTENGGRLLSDWVVDLLVAGLERENAIDRLMREHEPWEAKLRREVYRRSLRGRLGMARYRLRALTAPARRRIAQRIYYFTEDEG